MEEIKPKLSKRDKQLIPIFVTLALGAAIYFLGYEKVHEKKAELEIERTTVKALYDIEQAKADQVPSLNSKIEELKYGIQNDVTKFYGNLPQEQFLYLLQSITDYTELEIKGFKFDSQTDKYLGSFLQGSQNVFDKIAEEQKAAEAQQDVAENQTEGGAENNSNVVTPTTIPNSNLSTGEESDFANVLNIEVDSVGTFEQYRKLLSMVDNNKERLVITKLNIERKTTDLEEYFGVGDVRRALKLLQTGDIEAYNLEQENMKKELSLLKGTFILKVYLVPSVDNYVEQQELHDWSMLDSAGIPFEYGDFYKPNLIKTKIHDFDNSTYSVFNQSTGNKNDIGSWVENEDTILTLDYQFNMGDKNANLFLDLSGKGIIIEKEVYEIGLNLFSDKINDGAKLDLIIKDATNKEYSIPLLEKIYFRGWASVAEKIPSEVQFPIMLSRLVLSEEDAEEFKDGQLKLDYFYVGQIPIEEEPQETEEENNNLT